MGYRHYFYLVDKEEINKTRDLTYEELGKFVTEHYPKATEDGYIYLRDLFNQKEIFGFGKLYYENTSEQIYSLGKPLFNIEEVQKAYSDYEPYVVGKGGLLKAIDIYKDKIVNYYKNLLEDDATGILPFGIEVPVKISKEEKTKKHIEEIIREWSSGYAFNLDENVEEITRSWRYEYQIFELVRLLKLIDWKTQTILFYGW
jgi:hypothetical protein